MSSHLRLGDVKDLSIAARDMSGERSPNGASLSGTGLSPRVGCAAKEAVETAIVLARQDGDGRST